MSKNDLRASSGLLQKNKYTNLKKKKFHLPHILGEIDSAMTREDLVPALHDPGSPAPLSESWGLGCGGKCTVCSCLGAWLIRDYERMKSWVQEEMENSSNHIEAR